MIELGKVYLGSAVIVVTLTAGFWFAPTDGSAPTPVSASSVEIPMETTEAETAELRARDASKPKPVRLDVTTSVQGEFLSKYGVHVLNDKQQDAFIRLVTSSSDYDALETKSPMMGWRRLDLVPAALKLRRVNAHCVRLEDPIEPTANYYGICLNEGILVVHTVGDVPNFS